LARGTRCLCAVPYACDDAWEARRHALASCVEKLPEEDRNLLLRRYQRGEKVKNLAAELGVEPNTLSKRLERVRAALGKCIEDALKEEPRD
jgi:RNA polymerase sigma-70 factor (ECF subfamily)